MEVNVPVLHIGVVVKVSIDSRSVRNTKSQLPFIKTKTPDGGR